MIKLAGQFGKIRIGAVIEREREGEREREIACVCVWVCVCEGDIVRCVENQIMGD